LVGLVGLPVGWFLLLVILWGLGGGDAPQSGPAGPAPLTGQFVFSPGGTLVAFIDASAPDLTPVKITDAITGKTVTTVTDPHVVDAAAFSPNGKTLATLDANGRVYLRDSATGQLTGTLAEASNSTGPDGNTVAFSPDGTTLATSDSQSAIHVWDLASRRLTRSFADRGQVIVGMAFSPDSKTLAIFDDNYHTYLTDVASGSQIAAWTQPASTAPISHLP